MELLLTDTQKYIMNICDKIGEEWIKPVRERYDEEEIFPWEILKVMADSDLFGVYIPEEYGGTGGGTKDLVIAVETLSKYCAGIALSYAASSLGAFPILLFGNKQQKLKYLPDIASGKKLAAFGLTESGAGSDAANVKTTAIKDGDSYILNGIKQWITNGGEAETYVIFAKTDPSKGARGMSAFIVEKGTPGFSFGKKENKMGIRSNATRELFFSDCRVPASNILVKEGMGFIIAMSTFDHSRPGIAAQALGIAQGAMNEAMNFANERVQFNEKIFNFQVIQHKFADMATKIEAARFLTYHVAELIDNKIKNIGKYSAMAKVFASDVAMEVAVQAVQIMGGSGYMKDFPVEKYMRDAKITQIYEGTNEIQRSIIAGAILKEFKKSV